MSFGHQLSYASTGIVLWARRIIRLSPSAIAARRANPAAATPARAPAFLPLLGWAAAGAACAVSPAGAAAGAAEVGASAGAVPLNELEPPAAVVGDAENEPLEADELRPPLLVSLSEGVLSAEKAGRSCRKWVLSSSADDAWTPPSSTANEPAPVMEPTTTSETVMPEENLQLAFRMA